MIDISPASLSDDLGIHQVLVGFDFQGLLSFLSLETSGVFPVLPPSADSGTRVSECVFSGACLTQSLAQL